MSEATVLVIDDSTTIRRLVDGILSEAGYRVMMAASAEAGLTMADELLPDLILLDHQLPGTTGREVCRQLLESPRLQSIPVVVSSTLRKQAYVEYADCPNVVDLLPKPYTDELLTTTVANALDTGAMVVDSQQQGTAVPEVIQELSDAHLQGDLQCFSLRQVLDFINNAQQGGILEVELARARVQFYLDNGHIQAVTASGIDPQPIVQRLPEGLSELEPVLKLTIAGRNCAEVDGLVQLLNNKVLDPRLLRTLLRHQAAMLTLSCFQQAARRFRFEAGRVPPPLHRNLPLDISLLALLVEGALRCASDQLPAWPTGQIFARRTVRGHNLDRTGLSAQHQQLLGVLAEPKSLTDLTQTLHLPEDQVLRALYGLTLADLVEARQQRRVPQVYLLEPDLKRAAQLKHELAPYADRYSFRLVRDRLTLQLLLKRETPDILVASLETDAARQCARDAQQMLSTRPQPPRWLGTLATGDEAAHGQSWDGTLPVHYTAQDLLARLDEVLQRPPTAVSSSTDGSLIGEPPYAGAH